VPAAEAYLADEITDTNTFSPREITQTDQTTLVNHCAVYIPPIACRAPWSGAMGNEQNHCHDSLRDHEQDRARAHEKQRARPGDASVRHAFTDLRKSVQRNGGG